MTVHDDAIERDVPERNWRMAGVLALVLVVLATAGWEMYWRANWYESTWSNTDGLWAIQRRRASELDHPKVLIGSSRTFFDVNLDVWERVTGERPVQLALEGTGPRPFLADLADDPSFNGVVVVGVTPPLFFFPGFGFRQGALHYYKNESPAQWLGQRISMILESKLAFIDDGDLPLFHLLKHIPMANRAGVSDPYMEVRRLSTTLEDRNTRMWRRVEDDPEYRKLAQDVWSDLIDNLPPPDPEAPPFDPTPVFEEVKANVEKIRARGGDVVFIRCPSTGPWRDLERKATPREKFWDVLLDSTHTGGVHFEDNQALQGLEIPEWSHLSAASAEKFTEALAPLVKRALETRGPIKDPSLEQTDSSMQDDEL